MKNDLHFEQVDLLVIDPSSSIRQALTNMLRDQGFRKISLGASLADLNTRIGHNSPDLVITDDRLPDGDLCDMIQSLRHHSVGQNPFVSIIATTWEPTREKVRRIVQTGVDDLVVKPLAPTTLIKRINEQIEHRKPFVVTSSYIGPDRRGDKERDPNIELLEVPNTLREKASSIHPLSVANLQGEIDAYLKIINIQKLDRHADQVLYLVEHILKALHGGDGEEKREDPEALLKQLLRVAEDISWRMVGTPYAHVSELCQSLIGVTREMLDTGKFTSDKDVRLLVPLAQAIRKGFDDSSDEATHTVRQITASVLDRH